MFLKSMTLRGFKSFADKTELTFEPGITVIVGPNGSGKSNIVDALAWVLGSHSAKSLRGAAMADVIFAGGGASGHANRPALGRAAVDILIDNAGGALPIEFSEVAVSRAIFASGESSYAINDVECRLLDVQELLSDTGLGRQNHTIVGQGQIDAVLNSRPEERRAFVEEAAGILKHRRRKERALRKLAQMEQHLERLNDLLRELRRNLRPLERQAEAAQRHAKLQGALHDVRRTRWLRELRILDDRWTAEEAVRTAAERAVAALHQRLDDARTAETAIDDAIAGLAPTVRAAAETHFRLSTLVERSRGLVERIEERRRGLVDAVEEPVAGRDPAALRAEARAAVNEQAALAAEAEQAQARLAGAELARRAAEQARRAHEQAAAAEARRRAEARERQLRWEGEVLALRSALAQAASEDGRLTSQVQGVEARKVELERDVAAVQRQIQRLDVGQAPLSEQLRLAEALLDRRAAVADAAVAHERALERQRASLDARADALRAASQEAAAGASALIAAAESGTITGLLGALADHVTVADGMARAVAAALGPLGDALIVERRAAAQAAVRFVRSNRSGRVVLLVGGGDEAQPAGADALMAQRLERRGARPLAEAIDAPPTMLAAVRPVLADVFAVADYATACALAEEFPACTFVDLAGDVAGPRGYAGGSAGSRSAVLARAAAEQAEAQLAAVAGDLPVASRKLADAERDMTAARHELDAATVALQESDGLITAAAERLGRLGKELAICTGQLDGLRAQADDLAREIADRSARLASLETRGAPTGLIDARHADTVDAGPDLEAERLDDELALAREREVQARLAASTVEQRGAELARRGAALDREADAVERALATRAHRRAQRLAAISRCEELAVVADAALGRTESSLVLAAGERDRLEEARGAQQRELGVIRAAVRAAEDELAAAVARHHGDQLAGREVGHAREEVRRRLREELAVDPDEALAGADAELFAGGEGRDTELAEAEERLVRKVGLLGTVNPLALEEFKALQERHDFLGIQIEDLRRSRRDLMEVVGAVDERIREVFGAAFADVAAEFARIFPRLFPGGTGRLVLTDPDDLLETGIDVEAKPPGKRVKRLSLLSGGERSLTALAVLFAIFAARPSPFYVLDEVEAALDDVNLQRFLDVVRDFRATSQLLIVTHQQRTMEVADCLYGVSMQAGGVSKVISQRMTQPVSAAG